MNVIGTSDRSVREHAEKELEGHMEGPIEGLATADSLSELTRHLDAAMVDLQDEIAEADEDDPEYDYLRGRLVAVRDAERSLARLTTHGDDLLADLGTTHDALHEAFPIEE
jgi:hypothetical protein